jgi:oligoribonuclease
MSPSEQRFVWCDLEMTGLDVAMSGIIEMGLIVTGPDLKPIETFQRTIWQPPEVLERMEPFVREMHTKNGLLDRVKASDVSLRTAEKDAISFLLRHLEPFEGILAGNSIHTDRAFIARYMPSFDKLLHYRMVDVSSLKIICRAWYPHAPGRSKVDANHTVLSDLEQSIAELSFYRQTFFKASNEV